MSSADVIDKAEFHATRYGEKYGAPPVLSSVHSRCSRLPTIGERPGRGDGGEPWRRGGAWSRIFGYRPRCSGLWRSGRLSGWHASDGQSACKPRGYLQPFRCDVFITPRTAV